MFSPSIVTIDNDTVIEELVKSVNENSFTYNEMLKIFCNFPALYSLLNDDKWDSTMAYYVAHNQPEYFSCIPTKLITKEMYKSYLMNGARKLRKEFEPVVMNEFIELREAIFLLRTSRIVLDEFKTNKIYREFIGKQLKNAKYTSKHYSCIYDKIVENPGKYLGHKNDRDDVILEMIFHTESYNYEKMDKILSAYNIDTLGNDKTRFLFKKSLNNLKYMLDRFLKTGSHEERNSIMTEILSLYGINSLADLKEYGLRSDGLNYEFMHFAVPMLNEVIVFKYTFPNGDKFTFRDSQWLYKLAERFIKTYFKKGDVK